MRPSSSHVFLSACVAAVLTLQSAQAFPASGNESTTWSLGHTVLSWNLFGAGHEILEQADIEAEGWDFLYPVVKTIGGSVITIIQGVLDAEVYNTIRDKLNEVYPGDDWMSFGADLDKNNDIDEGERIGIFYRADIANVQDIRIWTQDDDKLQRSPVYGRVTCPSCELEEFYIVNLHANFTSPLTDLNALPGFYEKLSQELNNSNILIGGDMNAGAPFMSRDQWDSSPASTYPGFNWLLGWDTDSVTISNFTGALQRFVAGNDVVANGFQGPGSPLSIQDMFNMTEQQASMISLLKPVEVTLKRKYIPGWSDRETEKI